MKITAALFFISFFAAAQTPEVPHKMEFAGMTLTIRDDARREIQKDVDALTQSPRHYNIKAERAKTYFPIIEKIFEEEGVPDDFKYLVLQESALIADAVSTSNAVGFWQFKDFTAMEMGLRVDKEIDERLNIASSTRGAARYIKKNNTFFNNWLYALQAYQMGAGGVLKSVKESHSGETHAEINSSTYWYVKKFLAHKIAYESGVKGKGQVEVLAYENRSRKNLSDLAKEVSVSEEELKSFNKWVKSGVIPEDRMYTVMIPVTSSTPSSVFNTVAATNKVHRESAKAIPGLNAKSGRGKVNGIATIQALAGENPTKLAARAGVDLSAFLKWNDISISTAVTPGAHYLLGKKRSRATTAYHKVVKGETLWSISQQYGVRMKKLKRYNRLNTDEVVPGTTLWLASVKPKSGKDEPVADAVPVERQDTFNWTVTGEEITASSPVPTVNMPATEVVAVEVMQDTVFTKPASEVKVDSTQANAAVTESENPVDPVANAETITVVPNKTVHTVQARETLYGIAKLYNVGVMDLVNWNGLDLQQGIKPGQVLKLSDTQPVIEPAGVPKELFHEVKASDTLYSIARQYGVTIKEIMDWNGKKDFSLAVGEKLKVIQSQ